MEEKKIKICAITTISKTMGWFLTDTMKNLRENGYDISLLCDMDEAFIKENESYAKCIPLKMKRGISFGDLFSCIIKMRKIFKKEKFDVIYYMTPNASFYASIAGFLAGIKHRVYSECGIRYVALSGLKRKIFKFVEKLTCSFSTEVRAQSPLNMQFVIDEKVCKKDKIKVLGIGGTTGVSIKDCDAFDKETAKKELRKKYGIPADAFLYGYVGRVNTDKGSNELIRAFSMVEEKLDNSYLALVGMIDDTNPVKDENLKKAREDERIILTGNVPSTEVYKHMAMFDVLVHPTYREGFGKVLQEAMGMSLPIITSDVIGPKEVVENGISGILVPVKDENALAEKMIELHGDKDLMQKLSLNGRARAEKYFDRPKMLKNILDDMNEIVG